MLQDNKNWKWKPMVFTALQNLWAESSYLEARGSVKELDNMPNASFGSLGESWLQSLHHKENQDLSWQSRSIFQSQQNQL